LSREPVFCVIQLWRSAWQIALDHPLMGVGLDQFFYHYRSNYLLPAAWQEPNLNHPHNVLLDWWTRLGAAWDFCWGLAGSAQGVWGIWRWLQRSVLAMTASPRWR
jgi:putative inorganic carbon (HCO3(-)) transporter